MPVPRINANDSCVVIVRWHAGPGAAIRLGEPLVDVETTKAVVTVEATEAGWVQPCCREGDEVPLGAELAWIYSTAAEWAAEVAAGSTNAGRTPTGRRESPGSPAPPLAAPAPEAAKRSAGIDPGPPLVPSDEFTLMRLSPAAEALVAARGGDGPRLIEGRRGLVTRRLLERAESSGSAPDGLRRERISAAKRAEIQALRAGAGEHLLSSLTLYFDSASLRATAPGESVLPVILAEVAALLASQPKFTAFHEEGVIAYHDAVHLGVALDLGSGLRVVTLRDAASMDAAGLGARLAELALACAENRLQPADVQGATFTVTDLSALDVLHFAPLLNARQSAILAVGGDATLPGHPMSLTLAFDHRVANGREAGLFLRALRDRLLARADSQWPVGPAPAPAPASASARVAPVGSAPACDRCLIELPAYYEQFGRWGVMHQYLRPDGTPGLICHACLGVS